jgi:hypothetical protein
MLDDDGHGAGGALSAAMANVHRPGLAVVAIMMPSAMQVHGALSLS